MYSQAHEEIRLNGLAAREGGKLQAKRIEKNQLQHLKIVDCAFLTSKKNVKKKRKTLFVFVLKCATATSPPPSKTKLQQDEKSQLQNF